MPENPLQQSVHGRRVRLPNPDSHNPNTHGHTHGVVHGLHDHRGERVAAHTIFVMEGSPNLKSHRLDVVRSHVDNYGVSRLSDLLVGSWASTMDMNTGTAAIDILPGTEKATVPVQLITTCAALEEVRR